MVSLPIYRIPLSLAFGPASLSPSSMDHLPQNSKTETIQSLVVHLVFMSF